MKKGIIAATALLLCATPAWAEVAPSGNLQAEVAARLAEAGPGTRWGLVVTDMDGREIVAINPDDRFIPASNTKMFTTAAAFWALSDLDQPDAAGGAAVRMEGQDVVLIGNGDARLSSAADCAENCLAMLADAIAAKTRRVRDVIGDDSLFPDQRWSQGMSWNNIPTRSGTATSALTLDDNELALFARPTSIGAPPAIDFAIPYYTIDNQAVTVPAGRTTLDIDRAPNSRSLRLIGQIAMGAEPERVRMGIDDPAHYAAWRLKALLEARGVAVTGKVDVRHRPLSPSDDPAQRGGAPAPKPPREPALAQLTAPPLEADLVRINKVSQNLHAELMLRRLGLKVGSGSVADGVAEIRAMLDEAGVERHAWHLADGSGMSTYNRVAPRGMARFLRWIAAQPWGERYRATVPVAGTDGTISRGFKGTLLEGKLFAKTGTLNATHALSGYMLAKSGRTLIFSIYANDVPDDVTATDDMEAALVMVAEAN